MINEDIFLDVKSIKLSDSNRDIIRAALIAYKNMAVYQTRTDEYIEIQALEIDEILEKIEE